MENKTSQTPEIKGKASATPVASTKEVAAPAQATAAPVTETQKPAESAGFIANLDEILATSKSRTSGGTKIRANVAYTLVASGVVKLMGTAIPDQQKVVLNIMNKALTKERPMITEPELHKLVVAAHAAGSLKTKQEPWHIFRYYRTSLKSAGALKEIVLSPAEMEQLAAKAA